MVTVLAHGVDNALFSIAFCPKHNSLYTTLKIILKVIFLEPTGKIRLSERPTIKEGQRDQIAQAYE